MEDAVPRRRGTTQRGFALAAVALAAVFLLSACGAANVSPEPTAAVSATTVRASPTGDSPTPTAAPQAAAAPTIIPSVTTNPGTPSPAAPYDDLDLAPLDDPAVGLPVYWLGQRFEPDDTLPALVLTQVAGPALPGGGPADSRAALDYAATTSAASGNIRLQLLRRSDWDNWVARDPASDTFATLYHLFWDSPCAQREEIALADGEAVIYSSYQALADPMVTTCPGGPFDRFLALVFIADTVVLVNAPIALEDSRPTASSSPYNSLAGMRAIVRGLQPRAPVAAPLPAPTPAADLADLGSLALQEADLPGRYGYGDDGCSPDVDCPTGPQAFGSEGVSSPALPRAFGQFRSTFYQYEQVGFSQSGTPDPAREPPTIDSYVFMCVSECDPAAILSVSVDLLAYLGYAQARNVQTRSDLGEAAQTAVVDALVAGNVAPASAIIWRDGPLVGLVVIGLAGESGQALALDLATKQEARFSAVLQ
jgi:hypothetical protein